MAGRGRGRSRGAPPIGGIAFGRGKAFGNPDQGNLNQTDVKVPVVQLPPSPYPVLEHFPAILSNDKEFDDELVIKNQISEYFQSSNYYLKLNDKNAKLFSSEGETTSTKKTPLNFNWDYFPLELRPTSKRKKDQNEILASLRSSRVSDVNLSTWFDKLEEKEKMEVQGTNETPDPEDVEPKKETEEVKEEEEEEEFDDEELDNGTDYNTNYFDNGEGYLDEDDDLDEGPCY